MNVLEPNKDEHLFKHSTDCQAVYSTMLKYFFFISILLHLSLLLIMTNMFTKEEIHPTTWSTYDVTLVGHSSMGGTGVANAEEADRGRIDSPAPRNTRNKLKKTTSTQHTEKSGYSKKITTSTQSIQVKASHRPISQKQHNADTGSVDNSREGTSSTNNFGVPLGENGFGQGQKTGIGKTTTLPVALHQIEPVYPRRARQRSITGKVIIICTVNTDGSVTDPIVTESYPKGIFDKCACTALKYWTFRPARHQGRPVASRITVPFRFELN